MKVERQPAFVLHRRDYSESSLIIDVFSRGHGRLALIAKGAKRRKSGLVGILRPFQPLLAGWTGRNDLPVMTAAEASGPALDLRGERLYCGFYMNELLMRLLHRHDAHQNLYDSYCASLDCLAGGTDSEAALRTFEKRLLQELGYGLVLEREVAGNTPLAREARYIYVAERGPVPAGDGSARGPELSGATLLDLAGDRFEDPRTLRESKALMRTLLGAHLNGKPLHSRRLLQRMRHLAGESEP